MNVQQLPTVRSAPLPISYQEARRALAHCIRIDECKQWAAKAEALASYARQMRDDGMMKAAQRIQDRAMVRAGELLLDIESEQGKRNDQLNSPEEKGSPRQQAADEAGLSPKQAADAIAAAKVPAAEADALIESDNPPTIKELVEKGRKKRPKSKPSPFRNEWCDWVFPIQKLGLLPGCDLVVLAEHDLSKTLTKDRLLHEARTAMSNLALWIKILEDDHGRPE